MKKIVKLGNEGGKVESFEMARVCDWMKRSKIDYELQTLIRQLETICRLFQLEKIDTVQNVTHGCLQNEFRNPHISLR